MQFHRVCCCYCSLSFTIIRQRKGSVVQVDRARWSERCLHRQAVSDPRSCRDLLLTVKGAEAPDTQVTWRRSRKPS